MKNSSNNNEKKVPSIHLGCSMAETGANDYDDFDNPLAPLDIIPKGTEIQFVEEPIEHQGCDGPYVEIKRKLPTDLNQPSCIRKETLITITVPSDAHPLAFLKQKVVDITSAWVFMDENAVKALRSLPYKFHQESVAYGEFFRFDNLDTISLQKVQFFDDWKVLLNWEIDGEKFQRTDAPEFIIEVVMEK